MLVSYKNDLGATGPLPFNFSRRCRIVLNLAVVGTFTTAILDSGAEQTIVDSRLAQNLQLKPVGTTWFSDRRSVNDVSIVELSATFGALCVEGLEAAVVDLAPLSAMTGLEIGLILGREVFEAAVVDIDFNKELIAFAEPSDFEAPAGAAVTPLKRSDAGRGRVVEVQVDDHRRAQFEFDLGSANALAVQHGWWTASGIAAGRPVSNSLIGGTGGIREVALISLPSISVAGHVLHDVDCLLEPPRGALEERLGNGVIGMPVWSSFRVITDYSRDLLYLLDGAPSQKKRLPRNRSGLRVLHGAEGLRVLLVAYQSPAAQAGWQVGDMIVAINGNAVDDNYWTGDLCRWAEAPSGTEVHLQLQKGESRHLVLRDYY